MAKEYIYISYSSINARMSIEWNEQIEECIYDDPKDIGSRYFYPCNKFLKNRLDYYDKNEMGAFIWEGG